MNPQVSGGVDSTSSCFITRVTSRVFVTIYAKLVGELSRGERKSTIDLNVKKKVATIVVFLFGPGGGSQPVFISDIFFTNAVTSNGFS